MLAVMLQNGSIPIRISGSSGNALNSSSNLLLVRYYKSDGNHDFTLHFVISWLLLLFPANLMKIR